MPFTLDMRERYSNYPANKITMDRLEFLLGKQVEKLRDFFKCKIIHLQLTNNRKEI